MALGFLLAFSSAANAGMEITYKRSGAPLAKKSPSRAPVKIVYIKATPAQKKKSVTVAALAMKPAYAQSANKKPLAKKAKITAKSVAQIKKKKTVAKMVSTKPQQSAPAIVVASAPAQTSTMAVEINKKAEPVKNWGVSSNITYTRSLVDHQDGSLGAFMDFSAGGSYKFEAMKIGATVYASRDMKAEETTLDDIIVSGSLNPLKAFNDKVAFVPFATVGPAASKSDQYASLIAKTKMGTKISLDSEKLGLGKFGIDASIDLRKNFHEYSTAKSGSMNTEWASLQSASLGYGFTDKLSASFNLVHLNTWTYNGIQAEYFTHSQEIGYSFSKNVSVSGGHQMGYPFVASYKANGTDRDFDLIDENDSMFFMSLSVSY